MTEHSLEEISQAPDGKTAIRTSVEFICEELKKKNKEKSKTYSVFEDGFFSKLISWTDAYTIMQRTNFEKPIIRNKFFGLRKEKINHEDKMIVYGEIDGLTLYVKVNDADVISLCEKAVKESRKGKNYLHLGLDYNSFAEC